MRVTTTATKQAAHPKPYRGSIRFYEAVIITMYGQTPGMTAGTGQLVKLNRINTIVIKFLRNMIAIIDRYSYHKRMRVVYECF